MKIVKHALILALMGSFMQLTTLTVTAETETELPPLTKKDIGKLFKRGDLHVVKVFLQQPDTVQQLESTGVIISTIEPDYVIIKADSQRLEKVRGLGFTTVVPSEEDHKWRRFRALIHNKEELITLREVGSDVWPDHISFDRPLPFYVHGQAYDSAFKWAEEAGLKMERCHSDCCD